MQDDPQSELAGDHGDEPPSSPNPAYPLVPAPQEASQLAQSIQCVFCGYNLFGLVPEGACPECGTPIKLSSTDEGSLAHPPTSDSSIAEAIPCVRCGVNLQGSRALGACGGCDAPVWFSLYGTWLRVSDPDWLRRVRSGLTLWIWMVLGGFALGILGGCLVGVAAAVASRGSVSPRMGIILGLAVSVPAAILNVPLIWRITAPNPSVRYTADPMRRRGLIRSAGVAGLFVVICLVPLQLLEAPPWLLAVFQCAALSGLLATIGLLLYLRDFAQLVPDAKLTRSTTIVQWGYGSANLMLGMIGVVTTAAFGVQGMANQTTAPPPALMGLVCGMGLVSLAGLGFTIWLVILLFRFRKAFTRAMEQVAFDTEGTPG